MFHIPADFQAAYGPAVFSGLSFPFYLLSLCRRWADGSSLPARNKAVGELGMRALVIESGTNFSALAEVRALGEAGWLVGVGSPRPGGYSASTRFTRAWHAVPSPTEDLGLFAGAVNRAIGEGDYEVVFGAGDDILLALSYLRDDIGATVPYAAHETVLRALDKVTLGQAAEKAGISVPDTVEVDEGTVSQLTETSIVKPRLHWAPGNQGAPARLDATLVPGGGGSLERVREILRHGGAPLVQEFISGQLMGFTIVASRDSEVIAELQQMAPYTWRPNIGTPARAHTIAIDGELSDKIAKLVKELGWFGVAQLQFILPEDGIPRLIDFNGRSYASLALATTAGVNFPDIWGRLATGRPLGVRVAARCNVKYHWWEGDLRRSIQQREGGLIKDLWSCLRYAPGSVNPVWRSGDVKPFCRYLTETAAKICKGRRLRS